MNSSDPVQGRDAPVAMELILFGSALAILLGLMYWTYTLPTANGRPIDVMSFTVLWARELILVGIVTVGAVAVTFCSLVKLIRRIWAK